MMLYNAYIITRGSNEKVYYLKGKSIIDLRHEIPKLPHVIQQMLCSEQCNEAGFIIPR